MDTDFLSPLNLTVQPFTLGADGSQVTPDANQLINPNRTAMLIDEFSFNAGIVNTVTALGANAHEFASVQAKLSFGATPLTNDFIPLLAFAPYYFGYPTTALGDWGDCTLTWHLARPLYVPPDVQVSMSLMRKMPFIPTWNDEINTSLPWGFSIKGRSMPAGMEIPEKIFVPWACATTVLGRTANDVILPFQSSDADLVNPHNEPLNVDYFTGFNMGLDPTVPSRTPITAQLTLSNGKVLLRDPTPFNLLFPPDRPVLRCRAMLQPKEFVSALIDVPIPDGAENAAFTTIGMTGWREIPTPRGAQP